MSFKKTLLAASLVAASASASATVINGSSLQNNLDALVFDGDFYDVNAAQHNPDEVWEISSSGGSISRLVFEIAGYESNASFGIYDINNTSNTLELFSTTSCGTFDSTCTAANNFATTLDILDNGNFIAQTFDTDGTLSSFSTSSFSSTSFGYYLNTGPDANSLTTFFSQSALNGGDDHMVAYEGNGSMKLDVHGNPDASTKTFEENEFILAWEDVAFSAGSDKDYSDFTVLVESVTPVSEPGTLALLGLGLAGLGFARRKTAKA